MGIDSRARSGHALATSHFDESRIFHSKVLELVERAVATFLNKGQLTPEDVSVWLGDDFHPEKLIIAGTGTSYANSGLFVRMVLDLVWRANREIVGIDDANCALASEIPLYVDRFFPRRAISGATLTKRALHR